MKLLIIDDDVICTCIKIKAAQTSGLFTEIHCVNNGKEALDFLQRVIQAPSGSPDMIFLSANLPDRSGFIRELERITLPKRDRIFLLVFADSEESLPDRAEAIGIDHHVLRSSAMRDFQDAIFSFYHKVRTSLKGRDNFYQQPAGKEFENT